MQTERNCRNNVLQMASQYIGMEVSEEMRLRQLEEENYRLKKIVADLMLDTTMLKIVAIKNL